MHDGLRVSSLDFLAMLFITGSTLLGKFVSAQNVREKVISSCADREHPQTFVPMPTCVS